MRERGGLKRERAVVRMNSFDISLVEEQDPSVCEAPSRILRVSPLCLEWRSGGLKLCVPHAAEGHKVLYDREVPFEIRNQTDPHDAAQEVSHPPRTQSAHHRPRTDGPLSFQVGTLEAIKVKILIMGEEQVVILPALRLTSLF